MVPVSVRLARLSAHLHYLFILAQHGPEDDATREQLVDAIKQAKDQLREIQGAV